MDIKNKKILKSAKNFEQIYSISQSNRRSNKFNFLPNWLDKESNLFLEEVNHCKKSYYSFKRGALIFVDFGINIGSELSNRHWAVVLNKNDSPKSRNLTVLPISSKEKKFSVMTKLYNKNPKDSYYLFLTKLVLIIFQSFTMHLQKLLLLI